MAVPARTPPAIQQQIAKDLAAVMVEREVIDRLRSAGLEPAWIDGEAARARAGAEMATYTAVGKRSRITLD